MMNSIHDGGTKIFTAANVCARRVKGWIALFKTANYRMNIDDLGVWVRRLHHFRITPLWTTCTPLISKTLKIEEFD